MQIYYTALGLCQTVYRYKLSFRLDLYTVSFSCHNTAIWYILKYQIKVTKCHVSYMNLVRGSVSTVRQLIIANPEATHLSRIYIITKSDYYSNRSYSKPFIVKAIE